MWRAGSTYVFDKFRRNRESYFALQEPIHEIAYQLKDDVEKLVELKSLDPIFNHPQLDDGYFQELYDCSSAWKSVVSKSLIYEQFFDQDGSEELKAYYGAILTAAPARPVFQECRSWGRMGAIKALFGGYHIFLVRNPHDQWWSMLKGRYFRDAMLMACQSDHSPSFLKNFVDRHEIRIPPSDTIEAEFEYCSRYELKYLEWYELFILQWILSYVEAKKSCNIIINMDLLNDNSAIRRDILGMLSRDASIANIDFDDIRLPSRQYMADEMEAFTDVEDRIMLILAQEDGFAGHLPEIKAVIQYFRVPHSSAGSEAYELRKTARDVMDSAAAAASHWRKATREARAETKRKDVAVRDLLADKANVSARLRDAQSEVSRLERRSAALRVRLVGARITDRQQRAAALQSQALMKSHFDEARADQAYAHQAELQRVSQSTEAQAATAVAERARLVDELEKQSVRAGALSARLHDIEERWFARFGRLCGLLPRIDRG